MKRVAKAAEKQTEEEEVVDVLKSYLVHNRKFEEAMWREQRKEKSLGREWDEVEDDKVDDDDDDEDEEEEEEEEESSDDSGDEENSARTGGWFSGMFSWASPTLLKKATISTKSTDRKKKSNKQKKNVKFLVLNEQGKRILKQREKRSDDISNLLWNMSAQNML